jgi:hypothetical protein
MKRKKGKEKKETHLPLKRCHLSLRLAVPDLRTEIRTPLAQLQRKRGRRTVENGKVDGKRVAVFLPEARWGWSIVQCRLARLDRGHFAAVRGGEEGKEGGGGGRGDDAGREHLGGSNACWVGSVAVSVHSLLFTTTRTTFEEEIKSSTLLSLSFNSLSHSTTAMVDGKQ